MQQIANQFFGFRLIVRFLFWCWRWLCLRLKATQLRFRLRPSPLAHLLGKNKFSHSQEKRMQEKLTPQLLIPD